MAGRRNPGSCFRTNERLESNVVQMFQFQARIFILGGVVEASPPVSCWNDPRLPLRLQPSPSFRRILNQGQGPRPNAPDGLVPMCPMYRVRDLSRPRCVLCRRLSEGLLVFIHLTCIPPCPSPSALPLADSGWTGGVAR